MPYPPRFQNGLCRGRSHRAAIPGTRAHDAVARHHQPTNHPHAPPHRVRTTVTFRRQRGRLMAKRSLKKGWVQWKGNGSRFEVHGPSLGSGYPLLRCRACGGLYHIRHTGMFDDRSTDDIIDSLVSTHHQFCEAREVARGIRRDDTPEGVRAV